MRTPLFSSSIAAVGLALVASVAIGADPSPSAAPDPSASAGPAASAAASVPPGPVGPITWKRSTKGKGFAGDAHVADLAQLGDQAVFLCGYTADQLGGTTASLWASKDALKWTPVKWRAPGQSQCFGLVTWAGGLIGVGGADKGVLWSSETGKAWATSTITGSLTLNDVGVLGDQLVVVGDVGTQTGSAPVLWTSTDGSAWEAHPIAGEGSARHLAIAPDGGFVVAGKLPGTQGGIPTIWSSSDGVAWTQAAFDGVVDGRWFLPAFKRTPAGYVVTLTQMAEDLSTAGSVWTSADGITWQQAIAPTSGSFSAAGPLGAEAMVIGPGGTWRSTEGVSWVANPEDTFEGYDVLGGFMELTDGRWLAAGDTFDGPQPGIATWIGTATPGG